MDPLPRRRLGTQPPPNRPEEEPEPRLGLSVCLDRPFHELKQYLLSEFERAYVVRCLEQSSMNVSMASRASGLSRKHIRTLMAKYGIQRASVVDTPEDSEPEDTLDE